MNKPILCLDFDGVLHSYTSGWQGADVIPDAPVPGAMEFVARAVERFAVAIHSSRSHQPGGALAMQTWLVRELKAAGWTPAVADHIARDLIDWPTVKPPALVTIDDRAIRFTGDWPELDALAAFEPWNRVRLVEIGTPEGAVPVTHEQLAALRAFAEKNLLTEHQPLDFCGEDESCVWCGTEMDDDALGKHPHVECRNPECVGVQARAALRAMRAAS